MLIGLIADVHANVYGLEVVLDAIHSANADLIICAGDIVGYCPFVNEVIGLLRKEKALCIMGNHDAILTGKLVVEESRRRQCALDYTMSVIEPDNLDWLHCLPLALCLDLGDAKLQVYHGSPWAPLTEYVRPDYGNFERFGELTTDYVILGHTHLPLLRQASGVTVINPGSCGQPRDCKSGACYALLATEEHRVSFHRVAYDLRKVVAALRALDFPPELIEIFYKN